MAEEHAIGAPTLPHDTTATTEAHGGAHHGPTLLGLDAEGWVYVGLTIFLLLAIFVAKAPQKIRDALDARISETRKQLDEARALRAEAEKLLADAKAKVTASAGDAQAIVRHAETESAKLLEDAKRQASELTARRARMAEDKIAAAERGAVQEVRTRAAAAATQIAANVLAQTNDASADRALVDQAIARI